MDLPLTASSGVDVYTALHRLLSPSTQPTTLPVTGGATPGQAPAPPRFQLPAVVATPAPGAGATPSPPIALPQPGAPVTGAAAAPTVATANRAIALYAQIQQLVSGAPPAQLPTAHDVTTGPAPTDTGAAVQPQTPPDQPAGSLGINALGGTAESPVRILTFPRGSFVNFLT